MCYCSEYFGFFLVAYLQVAFILSPKTHLLSRGKALADNPSLRKLPSTVNVSNSSVSVACVCRRRLRTPGTHPRTGFSPRCGYALGVFSTAPLLLLRIVQMYSRRKLLPHGVTVYSSLTACSVLSFSQLYLYFFFVPIGRCTLRNFPKRRSCSWSS